MAAAYGIAECDVAQGKRFKKVRNDRILRSKMVTSRITPHRSPELHGYTWEATREIDATLLHR